MIGQTVGAMRRNTVIAVAAAFALSGIVSVYALVDRNPLGTAGAVGVAPQPVWTEVQWPFLIDQWGKGRAFRCKAADCGREVNLYLRAKIGFCNCTTGVADDEELERLSDFDLLGSELLPLDTGRPVVIAWMTGRSRTYKLTARGRPGRSAISIAFNDGCDAIVATTVLAHDQPERFEPNVIEFLNGGAVLSWAKVTLGL
jgi:hypothetical protein